MVLPVMKGVSSIVYCLYAQNDKPGILEIFTPTLEN